MSKKAEQKGFAQAFLVIGAVIVLAGTLGFLYWLNATKVEDNATKTKSVVEADQEKAERAPKDDKDENKGYVVLSDWGVKFKMPTNIGEVTYYKKTAPENRQGVKEYYEFSTKRVEELGGQCIEPNDIGFVIRLASLSRSQNNPEPNPTYPSQVPVNEGKAINGYYYYAEGGHSVCATEGYTDGIQKQDRDTIYQMLQKPVDIS